MKNFISITLISLFGLLPLLTMAIVPGTIPGAQELGLQESPVKTSQGLIDVAAGIVKWIYIIFFIVAVMFILFAAFNYLTAGGQPEKVKASHDQLIYAAIAITIALLAVGAQAIIKDVLKGGQGGSAGSSAGSAAPAAPPIDTSNPYGPFKSPLEYSPENYPPDEIPVPGEGGDNIHDLRSPNGLTPEDLKPFNL